jgi:hypothetical protein
MAFYKARTVGYKVSQNLGRFGSLTGSQSDYSGLRRATYGNVKMLGDVNAVTSGKRMGRVGRRLTSRLSGSILRSGRINTGIPQLDAYVARLITEQAGKRAQAFQGEMYDDTKGAFMMNSAEMNALINDPAFIDGLLNASGAKLVAYAKSIAPRKTGKYKQSFQFKVREGPNGIRQLVIYTEDPSWRYIEYGTSKSPAQPVLRRLFEADPKIKRTK